MSGPKGYSVRVESAAERQRRLVAAAQGRCRALAKRLAQVRAQVEDKSALTRVSQPAQPSLERLQQWEQQLKDAVSQAESAREAEFKARRLETMAKRLDLAAISDANLGLGPLAPAGAPASRPAQAPIAAKLAEVMAAAAELEPTEAAEDLARRAAGIADLSAAKAQAALTVLQDDAARLVKAQRQTRSLRAAAERETLRLAHLDSPAARALRQAGPAATSWGQVDALKAQVNEVLAEAERAADRAYIQAALASALAELGYTLDQDLAPPLGGGPGAASANAVLEAKRPDLPAHRVRLELTEAGKLFARVVSTGATTPAADTAAEQAACPSLLALPEVLAGAGVAATVDFHRQPGALPVKPAAVGRSRVRAKAASTRPAAQRAAERELGAG
ncbi:MAG: hypothetical protein LBD51_05965 [Bifidobacteriaceae bacterium]|jgi:hypothetical protein|nr:hypothetical protein [Bifidobacteriaceae bacterium]